MSTGLECGFIEYAPGTWYYILQRGDCPVQVWDWREFANAWGPFSTFEGARDHLSRHHANPGGYWTEDYKADARSDDVIDALVKEARV